MIQVDLTTKQRLHFRVLAIRWIVYSNGTDRGNNLLYAVSTSGSLYDVSSVPAPNVPQVPSTRCFRWYLSANVYPDSVLKRGSPKLCGTNTIGSSNFLFQLDIESGVYTDSDSDNESETGHVSVGPSAGGTQLRTSIQSDHRAGNRAYSIVPVDRPKRPGDLSRPDYLRRQ